MSRESIGNGIAQGVAANLVSATLNTPQGQAAVAETAALAVAAAPVVATVAVGGAIGYGIAKIIERLAS